MSATEAVAKGQRYEAPDMEADITVIRVARDASWADISVWPWGRPFDGWNKRQPLGLDGQFTFKVRRIDNLPVPSEDPWAGTIGALS